MQRPSLLHVPSNALFSGVATWPVRRARARSPTAHRTLPGKGARTTMGRWADTRTLRTAHGPRTSPAPSLPAFPIPGLRRPTVFSSPLSARPSRSACFPKIRSRTVSLSPPMRRAEPAQLQRTAYAVGRRVRTAATNRRRRNPKGAQTVNDVIADRIGVAAARERAASSGPPSCALLCSVCTTIHHGAYRLPSTAYRLPHATAHPPHIIYIFRRLRALDHPATRTS